MNRLKAREDLHHVPALNVSVAVQPGAAARHYEPTSGKNPVLPQVSLSHSLDPLASLYLRQQVILRRVRVLAA